MATPTTKKPPVESPVITERDANNMLIDQIEDLHDQIFEQRKHNIILQKQLRREHKTQVGSSLMLLALGALSGVIVCLISLALASHFHRF